MAIIVWATNRVHALEGRIEIIVINYDGCRAAMDASGTYNDGHQAKLVFPGYSFSSIFIIFRLMKPSACGHFNLGRYNLKSTGQKCTAKREENYIRPTRVSAFIPERNSARRLTNRFSTVFINRQD